MTQRHEPWTTPGRDAVVLAVSLALLAGVGAVITNAAGQPLPADTAIRAAAAPLRSPLVDLATVIAQLTNFPVPELAALGIGLSLAVFRQRWWAAALLWGSAALVWAWTGVLKHAYARPRPAPPHELVSYPSGHVLGVAVLAIALVWLFPRWWAWLAAILLITVTATDRILADAHWFSDTVGGIAAAAALVSAVALVLALIRRLWRP